MLETCVLSNSYLCCDITIYLLKLYTMLGIVNLLSTYGLVSARPVDSQIEGKPSQKLIINTDNIVRMKLNDDGDSELKYKLNPNEDRSPEFTLIVNETNAAIQTLADTAAASNMVLLDVYLNEYSEDVMTFAECGLATSSTTAKYYNIEDIMWIEENDDQNLSMMWVRVGGQSLNKIFVDHELEKIKDLVETGTTTTTTTSTSTTTQA